MLKILRKDEERSSETGFGFQTTSFIQSTQVWGNSSSVGFAHEINKNTAILRMNIRQVSRAKPTLLIASTATLFLPPSGGRLGWGWLCGFGQNQICAAHRATLSRRTGEGVGCTLWHEFLFDYRHSRADGNLLLNLGNCFSDISFLEFPMDARLRGNDGSRVFGVVCS